MGLLNGRLPEAAREFAASGWDRLYPVAWTLTGNRADAEDLVQESLIAVLTKWEKIERAESPNAYVRRLMINAYLSGRRRRSSTEIVTAEPGESASTPDHAAGVAERSALAARLQGLGARQRAVLVLRYYEDLPDAEIAALLDLSPGNVRVIAHRALAQLRAQENGRVSARQ